MVVNRFAGLQLKGSLGDLLGIGSWRIRPSPVIRKTLPGRFEESLREEAECCCMVEPVGLRTN